MDAATIIGEARASAGLSLRELALRAGTSHATLAAYEHGRKIPRVDTLVRVCAAAGQPLVPATSPRAEGLDVVDRGLALLDVLRLADAYPFARTGPLDAPVFARCVSS